MSILREPLHLLTFLVDSFVFPRALSWAMLKNISFLLWEVIYESGTSGDAGATMRAHSICGIATSSAFFKNWSIANVFDAAPWRMVIKFGVYFFLF